MIFELQAFFFLFYTAFKPNVFGVGSLSILKLKELDFDLTDCNPTLF